MEYVVLVPQVLEQDGVTSSVENGNITEDMTNVRDKFGSGGPRHDTKRCSTTNAVGACCFQRLVKGSSGGTKMGLWADERCWSNRSSQAQAGGL